MDEGTRREILRRWDEYKHGVAEVKLPRAIRDIEILFGHIVALEQLTAEQALYLAKYRHNAWFRRLKRWVVKAFTFRVRQD